MVILLDLPPHRHYLFGVPSWTVLPKNRVCLRYIKVLNKCLMNK